MTSRINRNGNSIDLDVWNIFTLDTIELEENNRILLKKSKLAFIIPNPSLDCSYVVLTFWPNLSLVVLIKLFQKDKSMY